MRTTLTSNNFKSKLTQGATFYWIEMIHQAAAKHGIRMRDE